MFLTRYIRHDPSRISSGRVLALISSSYPVHHLLAHLVWLPMTLRGEISKQRCIIFRVPPASLTDLPMGGCVFVTATHGCLHLDPITTTSFPLASCLSRLLAP